MTDKITKNDSLELFNQTPEEEQSNFNVFKLISSKFKSMYDGITNYVTNNTKLELQKRNNKTAANLEKTNYKLLENDIKRTSDSEKNKLDYLNNVKAYKTELSETRGSVKNALEDMKVIKTTERGQVSQMKDCNSAILGITTEINNLNAQINETEKNIYVQDKRKIELNLEEKVNRENFHKEVNDMFKYK